jgi:hypothetical protein
MDAIGVFPKSSRNGRAWISADIIDELQRMSREGDEK